jgi:hypothetical protein
MSFPQQRNHDILLLHCKNLSLGSFLQNFEVLRPELFTWYGHPDVRYYKEKQALLSMPRDDHFFVQIIDGKPETMFSFCCDCLQRFKQGVCITFYENGLEITKKS